MTEPVVRHDVTKGDFKGLDNDDKHFAALAWLREKQDERDRRERRTFWVVVATFVAAVLTLVATVGFGLQ